MAGFPTLFRSGFKTKPVTKKWGAKKMTKQIYNPDYEECYEYHGNTTIELTRKQGELTVWRDWITFDTVEEASVYFNEHCCAYE
jgi:hypothetical protein